MPIPTRPGQHPYDYDPRYQGDPRYASNDPRYQQDPRQQPHPSHETNGIDRHMMNGYPPSSNGSNGSNGAGPKKSLKESRKSSKGPDRAAHVPKPKKASAAVADPYQDMYADPHAVRMRRDQQGVASKTYLVEHLCTFTMDRKDGLVTVEDAIRKLKRMDAKGKVWSQDVLLRLTDREIQIVDEMTQGELENFNLSDITLLSAEENQCNYSSVLVIKFRISGQKNPQMYLFQCDRKSCKEIADDLQIAVDQANGRRKRAASRQQQDHPPNGASGGDLRRMGGGIPAQDRGMYIPPPPDEAPPNPPSDHVRNKVAAFAAAAAAAQASGAAISPRGFQHPKSHPVRLLETEEPLEVIALRTERDVQILNHCFDDVEAFIGQLQKAAEAYTELARRRRSRKNRNKKEPGDGLLLARSRPPPEAAYVECFQKFKYCFNLLAKLKAHIHDPNAPELVHFLFVPLELIIQSCQGSDLAASVVSPLLTMQGVELLRNCLTSRENELWLSLGQTWTVPESEWLRDRPPPPRYVPTFRNGWVPPHVPERPLSAEVGAQVAASAAVAANAAAVARGDSGRRQDYADIGYPVPRAESLPSSGPPSDSSLTREPPATQIRPRPAPIQVNNPPMAANYPPPPTSPPPAQPPTQAAFPQQEIKSRYVKVKYDFVARNRKELTIMEGETLEVLDDRRKWWWVRNTSGQAGYIPFTILDQNDQNQSGANALPQHQQRNPNINTNHQAPSPPPQSPMTSPTFPANDYQKAPGPPSQPPGPPPPAPPPPPPVEPPTGGDLQSQIQNTLRRKKQQQQQQPQQDKKPENKKEMDLHEELLRRVSQPAQKRNFRVPKHENGPSVNLTFESEADDVIKWLTSKGFNKLTIDSLGVLTAAQLFSLTKEELIQVSHDDGARVYSQLQVQKSYIESVSRKGNKPGYFRF